MTRPPAPHIPRRGDERSQLNAFLDYYRAALIDRAFGLDAAQLQMTLAPSPLSIGGLISHMAWVERMWFQFRFAGHEMPEPFASIDWDADSDGEMSISKTLSVEELHVLFDESVRDSRQRVKNAASFDDLSARDRNGDGDHWDLRWIMIHMIEEYARHCGHADLIRESIDGDVCE